MKVKSKTELKFKTDKLAKITYESLEVDNENFVDSQLIENIIIYKTDNDSLTSTLATIDDLIACEILSEKITIINY